MKHPNIVKNTGLLLKLTLNLINTKTNLTPFKATKKLANRLG
jgi:hypothetical protein